MAPERSKTVNGHKVNEYYWAGEYPVYVNSRFYEGTFEQAVEAVEKWPEAFEPAVVS